jgi:preprotein translocase subunit SecG
MSLHPLPMYPDLLVLVLLAVAVLLFVLVGSGGGGGGGGGGGNARGGTASACKHDTRNPFARIGL